MLLLLNNQFGVEPNSEPFLAFLDVRIQGRRDIGANDIGMAIPIVLTQSQDCRIELINRMHDISSLQLHITLFQLVAGKQEIVAPQSLRYGATIHFHLDVRLAMLVDEEYFSLVFLEFDLTLRGIDTAGAINRFHTPRRKLKSSEISFEAPSKASAEINLKSSSMMETACPSCRL